MALDDDAEIKIVQSEDETIFWIQISMDRKMTPADLILELEQWIHEVSIAQAEKAWTIDQ